MSPAAIGERQDKETVSTYPAGKREFRTLLRRLSPGFRADEPDLRALHGPHAETVLASLLSSCFFVTTSDGRRTVRAARWEEEAAPDRRATFQECCAMFAELAHDLAAAPHGAVGLLEGIRTSELLPVDYVQNAKSPIHRPGNLKWDWRLAADVQRLVQTRRQLIEREVVESVRLVFDNAIEKVHRESFLTGRKYTGKERTNRELRWALPPEWGQFAVKRDCVLIELHLLQKLATFEGFPRRALKRLQAQGLAPTGEYSLARCPFTFEVLRYSALRAEVDDPEHGRSTYHVAHVRAIRSTAGTEHGHVPGNVTWCSEEGNRLQGQMSLDEFRSLLVRIFRNSFEMLDRGR